MRFSARKPEYPKLVKAGSVTVKVYRLKHPTTASGFVFAVAYHTPEGRKIRQFAEESDAMEEARLKAAKLAEGRTEAADISTGDRDELRAARDVCDGVPLLSALHEWKQARALIGGPLLPAAEAWAARNAHSFQPTKVADVIEKFIAAKQKAGKQGDRTYRSKLAPLAIAFPDRTLDSISVAEFTAYLERWDDGVTRNDLRKRAVALCRWAQRNGYLPRQLALEIEATERAAEKKTKIGILRPETFGQLLRFARAEQPTYLAAVVLAGFCGIRQDEIHGKREDRTKRQTWEDIHLDRRFVQVTIAKTNTPAWRIVPLCDAAIQWLKLCPKRDGPVCDAGAMERFRLLAKEAGFELPENGFRHSFISYRIAATGDKPKVATEAGNSVAQIDRHYRVPLPEDDGRAWFAMTPAVARKLPPIRTAPA